MDSIILRYCTPSSTGTCLIFILVMLLIPPAQASTDTELLELLDNGNHFAIMRHELAPGTGDPSEFKLRDCSTQRNLDETGRAQSIATGNYFRANGISFSAIYSSQWCRCLETASLLNLGVVTELPALNSFYASMHLAETSTTQLREWLNSQSLDKPLFLVTHQVNISALTGQFARSGEIFVVEVKSADDIIVKGSLDHR